MDQFFSSQTGIIFLSVTILLSFSCLWIFMEFRRAKKECVLLAQELDHEKAEAEEYRVASEEKEIELRIAQHKLTTEKDKLSELRQDFTQQKNALKDEFKVLSEGILKERQLDLTKTNSDGIAAILTPLKEEISGFKKRVETVHSESKDGQGQLKEQLRTLQQMNSSLSKRADNLANALKNDKKTLGNWGEVQLERLLENAGFDKNMYRREANYKTEEGKNQRPDFVIDLPERKSLIIDSKVSLNAYVESVNAEFPAEALASLKLHTTNIRNHIKSLAEKSYISLTGINSPDFIFMFMPVESAYLAAFEEDPSLFDFAYEKQIAVVTPNTLLPILKTVQSLWRVEKQNQHTEELAIAAAKVHKKLVTFLEKFVEIESKIGSLQNSFATAKATLSDGKGNLLKLASDFENQGVKVIKSLPDSLTH